jgi:hypothetical protein
MHLQFYSYVAQSCLKLDSLPSASWDYKPVPPHPILPSFLRDFCCVYILDIGFSFEFLKISQDTTCFLTCIILKKSIVILIFILLYITFFFSSSFSDCLQDVYSILTVMHIGVVWIFFWGWGGGGI